MQQRQNNRRIASKSLLAGLLLLLGLLTLAIQANAGEGRRSAPGQPERYAFDRNHSGLLFSPAQEVEPRRPVVALHGAWHGARSWERIANPLTYRGHKVYAMDLDRRLGIDGSPTRRLATIHDYAESLRATLLEVENREGRSPIVIAHSMGGAVAQYAAALYDLHNNPMALLASVPHDGASWPFARLFFRWPRAASRTLFDGEALISKPNVAADLFLSNRTLTNNLPALQRESPPALQRLLLPMPSIPKEQLPSVLVMIPGEDKIFTANEQRRMARQLSANVVVFEHAPHDAMWTHPQAVADAVAGWIERKR